MATGDRQDPYGNFNFLVEIDNIARAAFQAVSGLGADTEVMEYREGGDNTTVRKLPGMTKYSNIVLKWGLTDDRLLYDWHRAVVQGTIDRRNGAVVVLGRDGQEVARWNFVSAWPAKWDGPDFDAEGTDVAIETLELAHEGIERARA